MHYLNKRFVFDTAKPEDGSELLQVLEESDFKGKIELLYTRRPDPYRSFCYEGTDTVIVVCRDTVHNKIAGIGACTVRNLYINGIETKVGYLLGMRVRSEYRKLVPIIPRGFQLILEQLKNQGISLYYTSILIENIKAQRALEKRRPITPEYHFLSGYETLIFKTGVHYAARDHYRLTTVSEQDLPNLLAFINSQGAQHQFFPVIKGEDLHDRYPGLKIDQIHVLLNDQNEIIAAGAVWDQCDYKQYIIKGYGGMLRFFYPVSFALPLLGYPALPRPGKMLCFFTLSFWVVKNDDPNILKSFVSRVSSKMSRDYPFFIMGLPDSNPLLNVLRSLPHISYGSRIYLVDMEKIDSPWTKLDPERNIYFECGML